MTDHSAPSMAPPPRARHARLLAYGWWQLADYLIEKGIGTFITMVFAGALVFVEFRQAIESYPMAARDALTAPLSALSGILVLLGVLFATNGIVSDDRKHGYYRFLFAKPVNVRRFYAQKFVVHLLGFLIVACLLVVTFNLTFGRAVGDEAGPIPFFPRLLLPVMALLFVALGGIGFLMSVVLRVDWLTFMSVYVASDQLWRLFGDGEGWIRFAVRALPPVHRLNEIVGAAVRGDALPRAELTWLVAYGLGCLALGLVALRVRPLAAN